MQIFPCAARPLCSRGAFSIPSHVEHATPKPGIRQLVRMCLVEVDKGSANARHAELPWLDAVFEAKVGGAALIIKTIFYNMIDYRIGSKACWISNCCAPSWPW